MKRLLLRCFFIVLSAVLLITCNKKEDENKFSVTGVSLSKAEITLEVGAIETLTALVEPADALDKSVTWESSNETIATVLNGVVEAKVAGTAYIQVTTNDGGHYDLCKVTVIDVEDKRAAMTLTTTKGGEFIIYMAGTGTMSINWGDGSVTETLLPADEDIFDIEKRGKFAFKYDYVGNFTRTITIKGDNITHLYCYGNGLTSLDVIENVVLTYLHCYDNNLTDLDLSENMALIELDCSSNRLSTLDLSSNKELLKLFCFENQLISLNIGNNSKLVYLFCDYNKLANLNVSQNVMLQELWCDANYLSTLNVTNNTNLTTLGCSMNEFTADGLNALFETLHNNDGNKTIYIGENPGTNECDTSIATEKGWKVEYNWW